MELNHDRAPENFHHVCTMLVYLLDEDERGINGCIANSNLPKPIYFHGVGELILCMDRICEWTGGPEREEEPRFLNETMQKKYEYQQSLHPRILQERNLCGMNEDDYIDMLRAKCIVSVTIECRRNHSLQGWITEKHANGGHVAFRSALELMRIFSLISLSGEEEFSAPESGGEKDWTMLRRR